MSSSLGSEDNLPRRNRSENVRNETARDEAFAGGQPTQAFERQPVTSAERKYVQPILDPSDNTAAYPRRCRTPT